MAKYKAYPKYKESGIDWIGDVPEGWNLTRLKSILIQRNEKNSPIKSENILSLTIKQGIIPVSEKEGVGGNKPKSDLEQYNVTYPNDIVLNSMNVIEGAVGLNHYTGLISPVYYALYLRYDGNISFFNYIFQSKFFQKTLLQLGNGILVKESESSGKLNTIRLKIPMEKLNNVTIPAPTQLTQQAIAHFLDQNLCVITLEKSLISCCRCLYFLLFITKRG